jgi:hypothetical protein
MKKVYMAMAKRAPCWCVRLSIDFAIGKTLRSDQRGKEEELRN